MDNAKLQKGVGIASAVTGVTSSILGNFQDNGEVDAIEAQGEASAKEAKSQMSKSSLSNWIADWTPQELESVSAAGTSGAISGALGGASAGLSAGPWGALAGGVAGLFGGLFGGKSAARSRNRAREEANERVRTALSAQNAYLSQKEAGDALANIVAFGGWVNAHGGDYPTGFNEFNEGDSHERNINGGVPQGIDSNGVPNLVEEGETKWDNYIFSKRLKIPKGFSKAYDLGNVDKRSYADASKSLSKESKERPFDPISKRGRDAMLNRLQQAQEAQKYIDKADEAMNEIFDLNEISDLLYAEGGGIHIKPSKRGTFTAAAKKHGKGVQEFARQVLANKENYSSAMVKKANFARNASKWHDDGGWLQSAGLFAPALANVGNLVSDIVSKPEQVSLGRMDLSDFMTRRHLPYEPIDREYLANKYRAQANATARNIINTSAGNPASARAALVAHNYNALNALGDMYIKSDEVNRQRKKESIMFDADQDRQLAGLSAQQQQFNLGQEFREYDYNARNRAARRNGIRTGVNTVAGNIGETSRYLQNLETIQNMFPLYGTPTGRFTGGVDAPTPTRTTIDPKTTWDFLDTPSNYGAKGGFLFDPEVEKFLKSIKKGGK